jgi:iron complex transport system ATP-binding protein
MPALFTINNLSFSYPAGAGGLSIPALEIGEGDFVAVAGANGSGKTTLLKILAGQLVPRDGSVLLRGRPLASLPRNELVRHISVVPQWASINFNYRAGDLVLLGRTPYLAGFKQPGSQDYAIAAESMERMHCRQFADTPLFQLSGGEVQKCLLAMVLAQQSEVLLLDEPGTYLDIRFHKELFELLTEINRQGKAVILVSHDLALAANYCRDLVLLREGKVLAQGPVREVLTSPNMERAFGLGAEVFTRGEKIYLGY